MPLNQALINELTYESLSTRKMLERLPDDKFTFKPHEKSMTLQRLASHVADLPTLTTFVIKRNDLDFAEKVWPPFSGSNTTEMLAHHDKVVSEAMDALKSVTDEQLMEMWALKNAGHTIMALPRIACVRSMVNNHLYHHRGQLSVYLRMLDVPVPGMYGPSADDM